MASHLHDRRVLGPGPKDEAQEFSLSPVAILHPQLAYVTRYRMPFMRAAGRCDLSATVTV